jgi:radical SAM protein with 4Fe4S-binding SPASM domain
MEGLMSESAIKHVTIPGLRLHLRRGDPDMLWVNGQHLLLLNGTAAEFVETFIDVMGGYADNLNVDGFKQDIASRMHQKYPAVPNEVLIKDFDYIYGALLGIGEGNCPVYDIEIEAKETDPKLWKAPPRMDLALTYNCNNNCYFCYTGGPQKVRELSTAEWKTVMDKLWDSGIPQVVFTGGEPTLRNDLAELVDHAQPFVTGMITNGRKLATLAPELYRLSLDYVQVTLESHLPEVHDRMVGTTGAWQETCDGIRRGIASGLEVVTNTTLTNDNIALFPDLIKTGPSLGLKIMACNTIICSGRGACSKQNNEVPLEELKSTMSQALEIADEVGIRLEWYSPTCYKQFNPLEFGFGPKFCSAAQYNMTIEPDGSVIPCQSWLKEKVGNILTDPWSSIWNHPVSEDFRQKNYLKGKEECAECEYLDQCYGGCPLEYSPLSLS